MSRVVHDEAEIERLDATGIGRGTTEQGSAAVVRGSLPGERIRFAVEHTGRDGTRYGVAQDILRTSPDRVDAECPHFLKCGGCDLLHAKLDLQADFKRARVATALGLPLERVEPVLASPRAVGYRAFAKLVVGADRTLGSYRPRTHDVQDMRGCRVHAPETEGIADAVRDRLAALKGPLDLRYVLVRASLSEGRAVVTLVSGTEAAPGVKALAELLGARADVARVVHHVNATEGDALWDPEGAVHTLHDEGPVVSVVGPIRQSLEAGAFTQVNPEAAGRLYTRTVEGADAAGETVVDLYAGSGGVGLALLAAGAARIIAVESAPQGTAASLAEARAAGVEARFEAHAGRVEALADVWASSGAARLVLNPPRKGAGAEVMQAVLRLSPARLVYVSCNPDSLARDLADLGDGYDLASVTPVDLFPHTRHVETVAVAVRRA